MTREEAINMLYGMRADNLNLDDLYTRDKYEALNMAIKALEQEPCEDCISRTEAIKALEYDLSVEADGGLDKYRTVIKDLLNAIYNTQKKAIEDLPSIQPKPKTGHWIMSEDGLYRPLCDKCGAHPWKGYIPTVEEATEAFKYCPNCGAKMLPTYLQFGDQDTLMSAT